MDYTRVFIAEIDCLSEGKAWLLTRVQQRWLYPGPRVLITNPLQGSVQYNNVSAGGSASDLWCILYKHLAKGTEAPSIFWDGSCCKPNKSQRGSGKGS